MDRDLLFNRNGKDAFEFHPLLYSHIFESYRRCLLFSILQALYMYDTYTVAVRYILYLILRPKKAQSSQITNCIISGVYAL